MKPLKIAMMSLTHGHTRKYYQTLRDNPKLDWVASCAEDQRAKDVYDLYQTGVPCYLDPEQMFAEHPDIEAVVLASANSKHMEQVRFCAERGIHILSMKIPTFNMEEYDEMIELCDKAGIVCQDIQRKWRISITEKRAVALTCLSPKKFSLSLS